MQRPFPLSTPVALPDQRGESFPRLVALMQRLLADDGCPWDREQTFATLRAYVLEEAFEVADAIDSGDRPHLCEELGDLLLQIVFQAELGRAEQAFGPDDVIEGIVRKLVRRHPHVFADEHVVSTADVERNWETIKAAEHKTPRGLLAGIPRSMSALARATKTSAKVERVGFDWPDAQGSREKVTEELTELDEAMAQNDRQAITEELGDVLFSLVNLARHLGVDAEQALHGTTNKFVQRFAHVESQVKHHHGGWPQGADGKPTKGVPLAEMDAYWQEAKAALTAKSSP